MHVKVVEDISSRASRAASEIAGQFLMERIVFTA
jgi:hypothetical protein